MWNPLDCLKLEQKLSSELDVITTTTHALVKTGEISYLTAWEIEEWRLRVWETLTRLRSLKQYFNAPVSRCIEAGGWTFLNRLCDLACRQWQEGKWKWMLIDIMTITTMFFQIGTITKPHEPIISSKKFFPSGFLHDLSLVSASELPQIVSPPETPQIYIISGILSCSEWWSDFRLSDERCHRRLARLGGSRYVRRRSAACCCWH